MWSAWNCVDGIQEYGNVDAVGYVGWACNRQGKIMGPKQPKYVYFRSPSRSAGTFQLIERDDGQLSITRDDVPLPGYAWPMDHLERAVSSYQHLMRGIRAREEATSTAA